MAQRPIFWSKSCDEVAEKLGGYERIDETLTPAIYDGLMRNPYGFPQVASDWYSARYIATRPFKGVPALVWVFTIDGTDVIIQHVELLEEY